MIESYINTPVVKSFLAGSLSGTCSTIIFQPLDLVKTRIQSPNHSGSKGVIAVIRYVVQNERLLGLWKGVAPSLTRTVPGIGVYFSSLHFMRSNFGSSDPHPMESVLMGGCARSISAISMLPVTVVKTRYESGQYQYKSMGQALTTIHRLEGTKGLFSGLAATLLRDAPFSGMYLMFYTQGKKMVKKTDLDLPAPLMHFSCGIVAGCAASVVTQPADVIKTHMQLQPKEFATVRTVITYIYQRDGSLGFFKGIVPRTMRRTMMAALAWSVYEQVMSGIGLK